MIPFAELIFYSKGHLSKVERGLIPPSPAFAAACDSVLQAGGELLALIDAGGFVGLPAPPARFVGRSAERNHVIRFLTGAAEGNVCVLSGLAGVGKTALALRAAWNAAALFPDGLYFFDLGGATGGAQNLLDPLLRMLGVPGEQIPAHPDALLNMWRHRLLGKRLLLVLDDVGSAADIAPLLTGEPGCKILATSRRRLSALDESAHLSVGVLDGPEADELFREVGGERAAHAEDSAVRAIVDHCGRLPLAVRIAAGRFRNDPMRTVADLRNMLSHETHRLEVLDDGDRSVTAALTVSTDALTAEQRRLLALLALHPGPGIDVRGVAVLVDVDPLRARLLTDRLADVHLVTYESSDRVTLHGLVHQFARQALLPEVPADEQSRAVRRLLEHSLRLAVAADKLLTPQRYRPPVVLDDFPVRPVPFADRPAAVAWLEAEWRSLAALCRIAAEHGLHSICWQLAFALREFFFLAKLWGPWIETHKAAAESAREAGSRAWLAISLSNLGVAHSDRGDLTVAVDYFQQALALFHALEDLHGIVNAFSNLAWTELYLGEHKNALARMRLVRDMYRRMGNRRNAAIALRGMALLEAELERYPAAVAHAQEARAEFDALELRLDAVMSVNCAAWACFRSGDHRASGAHYEEAAELAESCGSTYERARALTGLGNIQRALGNRKAAAESWARADALYGGLEPVMLGEARVRLAS